MGNAVKVQIGIAWLAVAMALPAARPAGATTPGAQVPQTSATPAPAAVVREIDDPQTGVRWLLLQDANHPGGPGRLVQVSAEGSASGGTPVAGKSGEAPLHPIIHTGDRLLIEEHTAIADAQLEAVALSPAVVGSAFQARLKIGGKVVRVMALGPGRAAFQPNTEGRP
jgi:hypothetical protein